MTTNRTGIIPVQSCTFDIATATTPSLGWRVVVGWLIVGWIQVAAQSALVWQIQYSFSSTSSDKATFCNVDSASNIMVVGESFHTTNAALALKFSPAGELLWQYRFPGKGFYTSATSAVVDTNGNVYLAADIGSGWDTVITILKLSPAGVPLWTNQIGSSDGEQYAPATLALDAAQNVYLTGWGAEHAATGDYGTEVLLAKMTPDGAIVWLTVLTRPTRFSDKLMNAAVDRVTGSTYATLKLLDNAPAGTVTTTYAFAKFSGAGTLEWMRYSGETNASDSADLDLALGAVLLSQDAGIYFAFQAQGRPTVWKYDSSGTLVWKATYNGSSAPRPTSVAVDLFGNVTLCASNLVIHFDRFGNQRWVAQIPGGTAGLLRVDGTQSPFLRMAVTLSGSERSMLLTRFEPDGSRRWEQINSASSSQSAGGFTISNGTCVAADSWMGPMGTLDIFLSKFATNSGAYGPRILSQSPAHAGSPGEIVSLGIAAEGTGTLTYRWLRDGIAISEATNASITFPIDYGAGTYQVEVSDANGVTRSAIMIVSRVPQLADQESTLGGNAVFQARVNELLPKAVVWSHDGLVMSDQTNAVLVLSNIAMIDAGDYSVNLDFGNSNMIEMTATLAVSDQVKLVWERTHEGKAAAGISMALDRLGHVVVLNGGFSGGFSSSELLVYTTNGLFETNAIVTGDRLATDGIGRLFFAGSHPFPYDNPIWVGQRNALVWNSSWTSAVSGGANTHNSLQKLFADGTGAVFVLDVFYLDKYHWPPGGYTGFVIARAEGAEPGSNILRMGSAAAAGITAFGMTPVSSNDLAVLWRSQGTNFVSRLGKDGTLRWTSPFPPAISDILNGSIASDAEGNTFTAGTWVTKWDASGHLLWMRPARYAAHCAVDRAGNLLTSDGVGTVKYSPNGTLLWAQPKGGKLKLDESDNAYVANSVFKADGTADLFIAKIDTNGIARWEAVYNSSADLWEQLGDIEVERDGIVYLCGRAGFNASVFVAKFVEEPSSGAPVLSGLQGMHQVKQGDTLTLSAFATGAELRYQWLLDGYAIEGATNQTLVVTNFQPSAGGGYAVRVQNSSGWVTSAETWVTTPVSLSAPRQDSETGERRFQFETAFRSSYTVERSTNLITWSFFTNYSRLFQTLGTVTANDNEPAAESVFYRVSATR